MKFQFACRIIVLVVVVCCMNKTYGQDSPFPQISGWKCTQENIVYNANNLWDIIDGAADLYLEFNFVDLHIARYSQSDSFEVRVELYRHHSPADAFGIYSQERDTSYNFVPTGVQGYLEKGVLNFFAGVYYIKISSNQSGKDVQDALAMIGKTVETHLKQVTSWPWPLHLLPSTGRLINTEQYIAKNFLGYSFFNSAFVATYKDSIPFKVFVMESETSGQAKETLDKYIKTVPKDAFDAFSKGRYIIHDPHHGLIEFILKNNHLGGVTGCSNEKTRERYIEELEAVLSH